MARVAYRHTKKPPLGRQLDLDNPFVNGLTACWLFNEGGGPPFDIAGRVAGSFIGSGPGWAAKDSLGSVLSVANVGSIAGDFVDLGFPSWLEGVSQFTVICRMRLQNSNDKAGWAQGNGSGINRVMLETYPDGHVYAAMSNGDGAYIQGDWLPSDTSWNTWAMVFDGSLVGGLNRVKIYKNGQQYTMVGGTGSIGSFTPSGTGEHLRVNELDNGGGRDSATGYYDWLMAWNRPLTAGEVLAQYIDPYTVVLPPACRRWFTPIAVTIGFIPRIMMVASEPSSPDQGNLNLWSGKPNQPVTPRSLRQPLIIQAEDITYRELAPSTIQGGDPNKPVTPRSLRQPLIIQPEDVLSREIAPSIMQGGDPNKSVTPPSLRPIVLSQVESVNEILAGNSPFVSVVKSTLTAPPSPPTRALVLQQQVYPLDARAEEGYSQRWAGLPPPKPSQLLPGVVFIPQEPLAPYTGSVFLVLAPNPKNAAGVTKQAPIPLKDIYIQITTFLGRAGG